MLIYFSWKKQKPGHNSIIFAMIPVIQSLFLFALQTYTSVPYMYIDLGDLLIQKGD